MLPLQLRRMRRGDDLTEEEMDGLVDLLSATARHDILRAHSEGTQLDDLGARLIAVIASGLMDNHPPALDSFIQSGTGSPDEIRASYQQVYDTPGLSPEPHVLLDALGTHLAGRDRADAPPDGPVMASVRIKFPSSRAHDGRWHPISFASRAPMPDDDEDRLLGHLIDAVAVHGDPFRAWLRVPGVDAADPNLIDAFTRRYHGPVATVTDAHRLIDHHIVDLYGTLYAFRPDPAQHSQEGAR